MVSYEGDFNGSIPKDMQPVATVMLRRVINPYMALRVAGSYGKLKGSSADVDTYYPAYQTAPYTFDNTLVDLSATHEYNFWPYGTGHDYRGAKRFTPYILLGLGGTCVPATGRPLIRQTYRWAWAEIQTWRTSELGRGVGDALFIER